MACNSKGTNDYQNCKALAYLIDLHPQQDLVNFFKSFNVEINIDLYSLSEMLQWIWRSQIRNNLAIDVYIPFTIDEKYEELYNELVSLGYNPLDLRDKFYIDICIFI